MTWKKVYYFFEGCVATLFSFTVGMLLVPWTSDLLPEQMPVGFRALIYGCLAAIGFRMLSGGVKFLACRHQGNPGQRTRFSPELYFCGFL